MITPISLESEREVVRSQLGQAKKVGAERFHIDIIDGLFADNITVVPADLQDLDRSGIKIDLHLLVDDPAEWVEECAMVKPNRIYAQIERMGKIEHYIEKLRRHQGIGVGLGLGLQTPVASLSEQILKSVEAVLLMAIEPGFGGTPFHSEVIPKIKELRARWDGHIVVDGGINPETYKQVILAGASEAGANSALWKGNFEENFSKFGEAEEKWKK